MLKTHPLSQFREYEDKLRVVVVKTTGFLPEKTSAISTAPPPPRNRNTRLLSVLFLGAKSHPNSTLSAMQ